jgi:hypothetical protein
MDQVAFEVLEDIIHQNGLAPKLNLRPQIQFSDCLKTTTVIRFKRNDCDIDDVATDKATLAKGVTAAETTLDLIKRAYDSGEFGPPEEFKQAFYRLAFDLNLRADIDPRVRTTFVNFIYRYYLVRAARAVDIQDEEALVPAETERLMADYLRDGSIHKLLAAVENSQKRQNS